MSHPDRNKPEWQARALEWMAHTEVFENMLDDDDRHALMAGAKALRESVALNRLARIGAQH